MVISLCCSVALNVGFNGSVKNLKSHSTRSHVCVCICVYMCVCIYMYIDKYNVCMYVCMVDKLRNSESIYSVPVAI
jgi:hypothetical protein